MKTLNFMKRSSVSGSVEPTTLGETPYRKLPNFYRTTIQLSTLLDVEQALGRNDYRVVLCLLGFTTEEVQFWGCRSKRPTLDALDEWEGTVQELADTLEECERIDCLQVLVEALVQMLYESQGGHSEVISTGAPPSSVATLSTPTSLWKDTTPAQTCSPACQEATCVFLPPVDAPPPSLSLKATPPKDYSLKQITKEITAHHPTCGGRSTLVTSLATSKQGLHSLLTFNFKIPTEITVTCLTSSNGRKTTEFLCNLVASAAKRSRCISNNGDLTWISNSTVYVNNFARMFLFVIALVDIFSCIFSAHHTPAYTLELIIAAAPVAQSLYVEQNLPLYRETVKQVKQVQATMGLMMRTLEHGPGRSVKESSILKELDIQKDRLSKLKTKVHPLYSDIRLCIISTLAMEMVLLFLILSVGLMWFTGQDLLEKVQDGFTSLAFALLCIDCTYNFAIVAVYYHDPTIETVLKRDRFRINMEACQESDVV